MSHEKLDFPFHFHLPFQHLQLDLTSTRFYRILKSQINYPLAASDDSGRWEGFFFFGLFLPLENYLPWRIILHFAFCLNEGFLELEFDGVMKFFRPYSSFSLLSFSFPVFLLIPSP